MSKSKSQVQFATLRELLNLLVDAPVNTQDVVATQPASSSPQQPRPSCEHSQLKTLPAHALAHFVDDLRDSTNLVLEQVPLEHNRADFPQEFAAFDAAVLKFYDKLKELNESVVLEIDETLNKALVAVKQREERARQTAQLLTLIPS